MPMVDFNLIANTLNGSHSYAVTIEESVNNLARMNIAVFDESTASSGAINSQGVDLTASECAAIGKHLLNIAERLASTSNS
jgi:fructose-1-phosphate kinase PfkB-like protein